MYEQRYKWHREPDFDVELRHGFPIDVLIIACIVMLIFAIAMGALMDIPPSWVEEAQAGDV